MKRTVSRNIIGLILVALGFCLYSCGDKPSENDVKTAIQSLLSSEGFNWRNCEDRSPTVSVDLVEIEQTGKYNKDSQYWPVRARFKGSYACIPFTKHILGSTTPEKFNYDESQDFQIYRDDYDQWQARMVR